MRTTEFIRIALASVAYNPERKAEFHRGAEIVLRRLVKLLGLKPGQYDLRHNQGGIAVSGEITLHTDTLYVQMYQSAMGTTREFGILWRTCKGRKDYTGNRNHWDKWDALRDLSAMADEMLAAQQPAFVVV